MTLNKIPKYLFLWPDSENIPKCYTKIRDFLPESSSSIIKSNHFSSERIIYLVMPWSPANILAWGTEPIKYRVKKRRRGCQIFLLDLRSLGVLGIKGNFHGCESTLLCFLKNQSKHMRTGEEGTCKGIMLGKVVFMVVCT